VLLQCLCSESPYLSIKLNLIYVCYTNITLYILFSIIRCFTAVPLLEHIIRGYRGTPVLKFGLGCFGLDFILTEGSIVDIRVIAHNFRGPPDQLSAPLCTCALTRCNGCFQHLLQL
jgi:hypothetical protein